MQVGIRTVSKLVMAANGNPGAATQNKTIAQQLRYALGNKTDILVTSLRTANFDFVLRFLRASQVQHTFKAIWAVQVPLGPGETCAGLGELCRGVIGATQLAKEQMTDWTDALLDMTYAEYSNLPGSKLPLGIVSPLDLVDCQASVFFQALSTFFRFRKISNPKHVLGDPDTYEAIRSYMREGAQVAFTWNGPVSFSKIGQNTGRLPTTLQFTHNDTLALIYPSEFATVHTYMHARMCKHAHALTRRQNLLTQAQRRLRVHSLRSSVCACTHACMQYCVQIRT